MEQFGFIQAIKAFAISKGWHFVLKFDDFDANVSVQKGYTNGERVLTCDVKPKPTYSSGRIISVEYLSLLSLGAKFDSNGVVASLDETHAQKYERRLDDLTFELAYAIGEFACSNELDVSVSSMEIDPNLYDTNIDFVTTTATFTQ